MTHLADIATKIRSKNAGPFWLTVDIFLGTPEVFDRVRLALKSEQVAALFGLELGQLNRYDIESLRVVKFSFARPEVQGTRQDRDMHGASFVNLLAQIDV